MGLTRIVLADDHHLVRQGLRALLEAETDFEVVAEASDGLEVLSAVDREKPDVLIVDLMMPGLQGMEVTRQVAQRHPGTRVLILSMHADESYVIQALRNGASGYILKDSSARDLVQAIRQVQQRRSYLSPPLSDRAIEDYARRADTGKLDPYQSLTTREREVLQLVAQGLTNQEIAEMLVISARTVETHRANFMRKLNLGSTSDVVRFAVRRGLISLD